MPMTKPNPIQSVADPKAFVAWKAGHGIFQWWRPVDTVICSPSVELKLWIINTCVWVEKPRRLFQWGSHCQDPQYYDFCDELWALIDDRNSRTVRRHFFGRLISFYETLSKAELTRIFETGRYQWSPKSDSEGRSSNGHGPQGQIPRNHLLLRLQATEPTDQGNLSLIERGWAEQSWEIERGRVAIQSTKNIMKIFSGHKRGRIRISQTQQRSFYLSFFFSFVPGDGHIWGVSYWRLWIITKSGSWGLWLQNFIIIPYSIIQDNQKINVKPHH